MSATDIDCYDVGLPCQRQAQLAELLEKTMKLCFRRAVVEFRQREVTERAVKVVRHVYSQFGFDLK